MLKLPEIKNYKSVEFIKNIEANRDNNNESSELNNI
jgi:hypothetical protein